MINSNILVGDDNFVDINFTIAGDSTPTTTIPYQSASGTVVRYDGIAVAGASRPEDENNPSEAVGFVNGRSMNIFNSGVSLASDSALYFYYPGTAPTQPNLTFTFTPVIDDNTYYITSPRNSFSSPDLPYDTLSIESVTKQDFNFTLPGAYFSYNQAIKIFQEYGNVLSETELRQLIRNDINHKYARAWAIAVVDSLEGNFTITDACARMKYFLYDIDGTTVLTSTFHVDCKIGQCLGHVGYRQINGVPPTTEENFASWGFVFNDSDADTGDMVK